MVGIIENTLTGVAVKDFDVVILACTHYPLVENLFKEVLGEIHVFDPAQAVAERVERRFWPREVGDGKLHFCISKDSEVFRNRVAQLFPNAQYEVEIL